MVVDLNVRKKLELLFCLTVLFIFSGAYTSFFAISSITKYIILGINLIIILLFLINIGQFLKIINYNKVLVLLLFFCFISVLWSQNTVVTIFKVLQLISTTLFGIYIVVRFKFSEWLRILGFMFFISIVLCFFTAIFNPSMGISSGFHEGAWKGIYGQKNSLGINMVWSSFVFLVLYISSTKNKYIFLTGFLLSFILILLSNSSSALIVFISTILIGFILIRLLKLNIYILVPLICFFMILAYTTIHFIFINIDTIFNLFNRDVTLTGRTEIWNVIINYFISNNLWLGYGYGVFWSGQVNDIYTFYRLIGFETITSHNGFLDIILDIGLIGLILFLINLMTTFINSIMLVRNGKMNRSFYWFTFYIIIALFYNFSESLFLKENSLFWILFVTTSLYSCKLNIELKKLKGSHYDY